jgi:flagellar motor switch protein FliN/FliY
MPENTGCTESIRHLEAARPNARARALLFDTKCTLRVVLGRARVPFGKLRKLAKGAVVELEGSIQKPVELLVKDCLVARGEVVVVNGNYGIRVTEVATQSERLQAAQRDSE